MSLNIYHHQGIKSNSPVYCINSVIPVLARRSACLREAAPAEAGFSAQACKRESSFYMFMDSCWSLSR